MHPSPFGRGLLAEKDNVASSPTAKQCRRRSGYGWLGQEFVPATFHAYNARDGSTYYEAAP